MFLMTAHGTFVGYDETSTFSQFGFTERTISKLIHFEATPNGYNFNGTPLEPFAVKAAESGLSFCLHNKYLCAEHDKKTMVVDRAVCGAWERFTPVADEDIEAHKLHGKRDAAQEMERFRSVVSRRARDGQPVKIYCGAGSVPRRGFLNLDIVNIAPASFVLEHPDELFIFPFADTQWDLPNDCVDYIFHEDFIEHIPQLTQIQFLTEALRVMKPGAWHRVNTPNLIASMKRHSQFEKGFSGVYTGEQRWGHIAIFSHASLKEIAELVGYRECVFTARHQGKSPYAERDFRPGNDRDDVVGNIYADLLK